MEDKNIIYNKKGFVSPFVVFLIKLSTSDQTK